MVKLGTWSGVVHAEGHLTGTIMFGRKMQLIHGNQTGKEWGIHSLTSFSSYPLISSQEGKRAYGVSPQRSASWGRNAVEKAREQS